MILNIHELSGSLCAISSKSHLHRLLICAALSQKESAILCDLPSRDIEATIACLKAMGARITRTSSRISVSPIQTPPEEAILPCGESGSSLRFLLPLLGALNISGEIRMSGRLPERPMDAYLEALRNHGMAIQKEGASYYCHGRLTAGEYCIPGNVSSQFLSGLLFSLPLLPGNSTVRLSSPLTSSPYARMTLATLEEAGIRIHAGEGYYEIPGGQRYHLEGVYSPEGDWSDAAVFLAAGALSGSVSICGLNPDSLQGDSAILDYLSAMGAKISCGDNGILSERLSFPLHPIRASLADTPDLAPVLAALAAGAKGTSLFTGCGKLRGKESDRLMALQQLITDLGGNAEIWEDSLLIHGTGSLAGGTADCCGDHRIAMAAALCSLISRQPVQIDDPDCVAKSHPGFWEDLSSLRKE